MMSWFLSSLSSSSVTNFLRVAWAALNSSFAMMSSFFISFCIAIVCSSNSFCFCNSVCSAA
ncbi:MAG: hypothetical protein ACW98X_26480, partial [Promethearchaeota archaeon]